MKRTGSLLFAILLICTLFSGCATETPPALEGDSAYHASEGTGAKENKDDTQQTDGALSPLYGKQIKDGTYPIEVSSSSSMFRVVDAQLTVKEGTMTAVLTLSGTGYEKLYMGTSEEALADTDDKCIYFVEDAEGQYTYQVPVVALDQDIDCAAWSIRKEKWYDRVLVFQSTLIPEDAIQTA